jgi:hypothetical protein
MYIMQLQPLEAQYNRTSAEVSAEAGVSIAIVRRYADLGLLEHQRTRGGIRLFRGDAAEQVRKLREQRMERWRGGPRKAPAL